MNIEQQIANQVRQLSDKQLAELAVQAGFSLVLQKPKAAPAPAQGNGQQQAKPRAPKTTAPSADGVDHPKWNVLARLQEVGKAGLGMGTAELMAKTGLTKLGVVKGVKAALADGTVFKGGDKRFARYGVTQKIADDASIAARGGG